MHFYQVLPNRILFDIIKIMITHFRNDITTRRTSRRQAWRKRLTLLALSAVIASMLASLWAFVVEPGLLTITRLTVTDPDLPASWDGRVIALISDTHVGKTFDEGRMSRVADVIAEAEPDLVLFAGDLIDHRTPYDDEFATAISSSLLRMRGTFGQFAVRGNHDNRTAAELALAENMLADGGFQMLVNESVILDGLLLGGLDERYFGQPDIEATFPDNAAAESLWRLLLVHQPDYAASLPAGSADLSLAGHTHNGQIAIFDMPIKTVYLGRWYPYGLYQLDDGGQLAVTRGLGTIVFSARFGAPPEVMLITLSLE